MRILIDTNIIIEREENAEISSELQELLVRINQLRYQLLVHPLSAAEISKDKDLIRRKIKLSKIATYVQMERPPVLSSSSEYYVKLGKTGKNKDAIDDNLLFCIFKNAAHLLITEDKMMRKKAKKLGISEQVYSISEALDFFQKLPDPGKTTLSTSPAVKEIPVYEIDYNDPFFGDIKKDYNEKKFRDWWKKICQEGRKAWVYQTEKGLGAILIYKTEDEEISSLPPLLRKPRVKISTLKVTHTGFKIGELLIRLSLLYSIKNQIDEVYLTHYTKTEDRLVELINEYGFAHVAKKADGEDIYLKKIIPDRPVDSPLEVQRLFYPSFYDGIECNKFIVPIQPRYHHRLFTDYSKRQPTLDEFSGGLIVEGNTIKKAYLCHSKIRKIKPGDLLLFYRSSDLKALTSIGVVEKAIVNLLDVDKILIEVGKRTVYSQKEIKDMISKPVTVLLFYSNFHLPKSISFKEMIEQKILNGTPQSIQGISHEKYLRIRSMSGLDSRYCIDELKK